MNLPMNMVEMQKAVYLGEIDINHAVEIQLKKLEALSLKGNCLVEFIANNLGQNLYRSGPLAGVVLAHKDIFDLPGRTPGLGVHRGHANLETKPAQVMRQLTEAGALNAATLNMSPYACGATGANPFMGDCINPIDPSWYLGGSSSGSAHAVASEMIYVSLGTDTSGSVRMPAASCSLIGLKTTHGLISNQGVAPLAESLDGVGLIARNIPDATEFLRHCINPSKLSEKNDINLNSQLRMQSWIPESMISSGVAAKLLAVSKEAKANVMTNDVQEFEVLSDLSEVLLQGEVCMTHQQSLISSQDNEFHPLNRLPGLKQLIFNGLAQPRKWIQIAIEQRAKRREEFILKYLSKSDVLMIPCFADSLPLAEEVNSHSQQFNFAKLLGLYRFMGFVNYLGLPSLCVPVGLDHLGRPISVQLLARPFEDFSLLNFGDIFLKSIATNKSVFSPPNPLH